MARQMKDSGIEWIGEIPETWDTIKFKYLFSITGGNGFPENLQGQTEGTYPFCKVSDINGHSDYVDTAANYVSDEVAKEHGFNIIPCGSIIIAKIGAALQKNHRKINSVPCCIDNNTQALVPIRADNLRYLLYLTRCIDMGWFDNNSTVPSLNNNKLLNFFVPNVSVAEQHRIAAFLDRKCAEIDAVIERTKATIEEYKKLKQAVITEAVTKGVRGPRPMKDSGIEWIGEIPEEWEVAPLKYFITDYKAGPFGSSLITDKLNSSGTILVYTPEHVAKKTAELEFNLYLPDERREEMQQFVVTPGDIIFPIVGSLGRSMLVTDDMPMGIINQRLAKFRLSASTLVIEYFLWLFSKSSFYNTYIDLNCRGSIIVNLTKQIVYDMPVPHPMNLSEQAEIVAYLGEKCAALDTLIAKKTALLTELETYKKSLIYEYVTGKKEVI